MQRQFVISRRAEVGGAVSDLKIVTLANLHPRMEGSVLLDWLKQEGELVRQGEPLYVVETRKGVFDVPCECEGRIGRLLVARGASVEAGQAIALVGPAPQGSYQASQ